MAYIHIGGEYSIPQRMIIGLFDLDGTTTELARGTREWLADAEARGMIEYVSDDIPRTYVLTFERVYVTSISVTTLRARLRSEERMNDDDGSTRR